MRETVKIDLHALLTRTIDNTVQSFAEIMTPPGDNPLATEANLNRTIAEACKQKAAVADAVVVAKETD